MKISLSTLADKVAMRLGELPDRRYSGDGRSVSLEEMLRLCVEEEAVKLTVAAPLESLLCVKNMYDTLRSTAEWGEEGDEVTADLPADFLRLRLLRLKGWTRGVERATVPDDGTCAGLRLALRDAAPFWMQRQAQRPVVALLPPLGDGPMRILMAPKGTGVIAEALYIPRPVLQNPTMDNATLDNISADIISMLVERLVTIIQST